MDKVSQALTHHKMEVLERSNDVDARFNRVALSRCALDYLELGAAVRVNIDWDAIEDFYLLYTDLGDETETKVLGKTLTLHGMRKNGQEFPIEVSVNSWTTQSHPSYCGFIRDISRQPPTEVNT